MGSGDGTTAKKNARRGVWRMQRISTINIVGSREAQVVYRRKRSDTAQSTGDMFTPVTLKPKPPLPDSGAELTLGPQLSPSP